MSNASLLTAETTTRRSAHRGAARFRDQLLRQEDHERPVVGRSAAICDVYELLRRVASAPNTTILLHGESGVGKEVAARAVHRMSPRAEGPFVAINCAAISESLLESELFGYERGAFSGAQQRKLGLFEAANGGTILLDEIGEMPLALQTKLLRVLQERCFYRVGGIEAVPVDVRVISSTHQDLGTMVAEGTFRQDLYYRLDVVRAEIPPLRQRQDDVQALATTFLAEFADELGRELRGFSPAALDALRSHSWPGNVRELRNVVERAAVLAPSNVIERRDLRLEGAEAVPAGAAPELLDATLAEVERVHITRVLDMCQGNKSRAARKLNIHRTTLAKKMTDYGLAS